MPEEVCEEVKNWKLKQIWKSRPQRWLLLYVGDLNRKQKEKNVFLKSRKMNEIKNELCV